MKYPLHPAPHQCLQQMKRRFDRLYYCLVAWYVTSVLLIGAGCFVL